MIYAPDHREMTIADPRSSGDMIKPGATVIASSPYGIDAESNEDNWAFMFLNPDPPFYSIILPPYVTTLDYHNVADAGLAWDEFTR